MNNQYLSAEDAAAVNGLMPGNQLYGIGDKLRQALSAGLFLGTKWYLDPVNGNDSYDGLSAQTAFKTLPVAYAALTENKNEVLYIIGGASALNLASAFTWAKSYTHLIGIAGELRFGGRVRIGHNANFATMFTLSGSGCMFHNIHFQTGRGSTTNVTQISISGLRNLFSNCHFEAMLSATESGGTQAWRAVSLASAAQANGFSRCTFGSWTTVWASASGRLVSFEGDNGDTWFDDCVFITNTSSTSMVPVNFTGPISGGYSYVAFNRCKFLNTNAAPAVIFGTPTNGHVLVSDCTGFNFTAWAAITTQHWICSGPAANKAGGLAVNVT